MPYAKILLKGDGPKRDRTVYLRVLSVGEQGTYLGFEVNPKTLVEKGCHYDTEGVLHETKQLIYRDAIEAVTPLWQDIRTGDLTVETIAEQKVSYGIE